MEGRGGWEGAGWGGGAGREGEAGGGVKELMGTGTAAGRRMKVPTAEISAPSKVSSFETGVSQNTASQA